MDRKETNKKINQISEELGLLADQNVKLVHKLSEGVESHDVLKAKNVGGILKVNGNQLEVALIDLGIDIDWIHITPPPPDPSDPSDPPPPDPSLDYERQRSVVLIEVHRSSISNLVNDTEQYEDREAEVLFDKLQITKKLLEADNLRLSLQDSK